MATKVIPPSKASKATAKAVSAKANVKPAKVAPVKLTPLVAIKGGSWMVAIGSKGCALFKGQLNSESEVIPLEDCHGKAASLPPVCKAGKGLVGWKGKSEEATAGKAVRAWVSEAGQPVTILPLVQAIKSGECVTLKATIQRDGKEFSGNVIVPKGTKAGHKAPQYVGTELPGMGGRFETRSLSKLASGRADNQRFLAGVIL